MSSGTGSALGSEADMDQLDCKLMATSISKCTKHDTAMVSGSYSGSTVITTDGLDDESSGDLEEGSDCEEEKEEEDGANTDDNSDDDDDDVFSSGEEEMMQRMTAMRSAAGGGGRRLSSLDMYLLQKKDDSVNYVLKTKEKLHDVIEEVNAFKRSESDTLTEEQRRRMASDRKRKEMMMARMQRDDVRRRESVLKDIADAKINKIRNQTVCKKMGCLTPEKRARLKQLLMQKAKEEFRNEQRELLRVKEAHLKEICPPLQLDNLNDEQLRQLVKDLHAKALKSEASKREWEEKIYIQMEEMHDIMQEMRSHQGRFVVPVLRKVKRQQPKKTPRVRVGQNLLAPGVPAV